VSSHYQDKEYVCGSGVRVIALIVHLLTNYRLSKIQLIHIRTDCKILSNIILFLDKVRDKSQSYTIYSFRSNLQCDTTFIKS